MSSKSNSSQNNYREQEVVDYDDPNFSNNTEINRNGHIANNQYNDEKYDEVVYYDRPNTDKNGIVRYNNDRNFDRQLDPQFLEKIKNIEKYEEMLYRMNYFNDQNNRQAIDTPKPVINTPVINIESNRTQSNIRISGLQNDSNSGNGVNQLGDGTVIPQINIKIDQGGEVHPMYFSVLFFMIFIQIVIIIVLMFFLRDLLNRLRAKEETAKKIKSYDTSKSDTTAHNQIDQLEDTSHNYNFPGDNNFILDSLPNPKKRQDTSQIQSSVWPLTNNHHGSCQLDKDSIAATNNRSRYNSQLISTNSRYTTKTSKKAESIRIKDSNVERHIIQDKQINENSKEHITPIKIPPKLKKYESDYKISPHSYDKGNLIKKVSEDRAMRMNNKHQDRDTHKTQNNKRHIVSYEFAEIQKDISKIKDSKKKIYNDTFEYKEEYSKSNGMLEKQRSSNVQLSRGKQKQKTKLLKEIINDDIPRKNRPRLPSDPQQNLSSSISYSNINEHNSQSKSEPKSSSKSISDKTENSIESTGGIKKKLSRFLLAEESPKSQEFKETSESCTSEKEEKVTLPYENGKFNRTFTKPSVIGQGAYGEVYKVIHKLENKAYAVKKIKLTFSNNLNDKNYKENINNKVLNEVRTMSMFDHRNVVRFITSWVEHMEVEPKIASLEESSKKNVKKVSSGSNADENSESQTNGENGDFGDFTKTFASDLNINSKKQYDFDIIQDMKRELDFSYGNNNYGDNKKQNNSDFMIELKIDFKSDKNNNQSVESIFQKDKYKDKISNKNIVIKKAWLFIQMEYCEKSSLCKYISGSNEDMISRVDIYHIFKSIQKGIIYIHAKGVIHRDQKPGNIYLGNEGVVKIGDFGLAVTIPHFKRVKDKDLLFSRPTGTPLYTAPEQMELCRYNEKTDIYCQGIILFEMISSFKTYHQKLREIEGLKTSCTVPDRIKEAFPYEAELVQAMTKKELYLRPSASDILKHPSFKNLGKHLKSYQDTQYSDIKKNK